MAWIYHPKLDRKIEVPDSAVRQHRLSGWKPTTPPPPVVLDDLGVPVVEDDTPTPVVEDDVEKPRRARKPQSKES